MRAVDAVGAAVGQHARRRVAHRPEGLDVAHRHRGRGEDGDLARQRRQRARHGRLADRVAERGGDALRGGGVGARATRPATGSAAVGRRSSAPTRRGRRRGPRRRRRPGPARRPRGRRRPGGPSRPASHWRSGLEVGRSPMRMTVRGDGRRRSPRRAAARRSARRPRGRGARPRAGRPAAASPSAAAAVASASARPSSRSWRPGDDHRALAGVELDRGRRRRRRRARGRGSSCAGGQRRVEHERLAQGEVQVHGAGAPRHGRLVGAEGELADPAQPLGRRARASRPRRTTSRRPP